MRKPFIFVILLLVMAFGAKAQGQISFMEESFDFGNVVEGSEAVHEFKFKNTGNAPIILSNVRASCGCTTPAWTREPVAPGQMGSIKASYNSKGRPGVFSKTITVTSNAAESSKTLMIKGMVTEKSLYTDDQLANSPELVLAKASHDFGKVETGQTLKYTATFINKGKSDLKISSVASTCRCITALTLPEPIAPGKTGEMTLTYVPQGNGMARDVMTVYSNDLKSQKVNMAFTAELVDNLASQSIMRESETRVPFK